MKKQLLAAILAITPFFTAASSFAKASEDTAGNAELLVCLQQIKVDTKRHLEDIAQHKQELKKRWYKNYSRAKKTWKNLYSFFEAQEKEENKKWGIETDPFDLHILCNQMNSLGTIHAPNTVTNQLCLFFRKYTPYETRKVEAIIAKYFKNMTIDEFADAFDDYRVASIISDKPYFLQLLKKVDAKITELERIQKLG